MQGVRGQASDDEGYTSEGQQTMKTRRRFSTRAKAVFGCLGLLALACASAQAPQTAQSRTVLLVSDACPVVHTGDAVSLDWNPDFDPIWPVTGLRSFELRFAAVRGDGVTVASRATALLGGRGTRVNISSIGNGFFHIEIPVSRGVAPGVYHLVEARAIAQLPPDYNGPNPTMTVSPVRERYCITVVSSAASQALQPGS
jgi:hypothetical protein